eukprot:scaffold1453_cov112-Isochrysis_galbana.AAC.21
MGKGKGGWHWLLRHWRGFGCYSLGCGSIGCCAPALTAAMSRCTTPTMAESSTAAWQYSSVRVGWTISETESATSIEMSAKGPSATWREEVSGAKTASGSSEE